MAGSKLWGQYNYSLTHLFLWIKSCIKCKFSRCFRYHPYSNPKYGNCQKHKWLMKGNCQYIWWYIASHCDTNPKSYPNTSLTCKLTKILTIQGLHPKIASSCYKMVVMVWWWAKQPTLLEYLVSGALLYLSIIKHFTHSSWRF